MNKEKTSCWPIYLTLDFTPFIRDSTNVRSIYLNFELMRWNNSCSVLASHPPSYTFCAKQRSSNWWLKAMLDGKWLWNSFRLYGYTDEYFLRKLFSVFWVICSIITMKIIISRHKWPIKSELLFVIHNNSKIRMIKKISKFSTYLLLPFCLFLSSGYEFLLIDGKLNYNEP